MLWFLLLFILCLLCSIFAVVYVAHYSFCVPLCVLFHFVFSFRDETFLLLLPSTLLSSSLSFRSFLLNAIRTQYACKGDMYNYKYVEFIFGSLPLCGLRTYYAKTQRASHTNEMLITCINRRMYKYYIRVAQRKNVIDKSSMEKLNRQVTMMCFTPIWHYTL